MVLVLPPQTSNRPRAADLIQQVSASCVPTNVRETLWDADPGFAMKTSSEPAWLTSTRFPDASTDIESGSTSLSATTAPDIVSMALPFPINTGVSTTLVPMNVTSSTAGKTFTPLASRFGFEAAMNILPFRNAISSNPPPWTVGSNE